MKLAEQHLISLVLQTYSCHSLYRKHLGLQEQGQGKSKGDKVFMVLLPLFYVLIQKGLCLYNQLGGITGLAAVQQSLSFFGMPSFEILQVYRVYARSSTILFALLVFLSGNTQGSIIGSSTKK